MFKLTIELWRYISPNLPTRTVTRQLLVECHTNSQTWQSPIGRIHAVIFALIGQSMPQRGILACDWLDGVCRPVPVCETGRVIRLLIYRLKNIEGREVLYILMPLPFILPSKLSLYLLFFAVFSSPRCFPSL